MYRVISLETATKDFLLARSPISFRRSYVIYYETNELAYTDWTIDLTCEQEGHDIEVTNVASCGVTGNIPYSSTMSSSGPWSRQLAAAALVLGAVSSTTTNM